jgi:hypothetical protein
MRGVYVCRVATVLGSMISGRADRAAVEKGPLDGMDGRYLQGTPVTVHRRLMLLNMTLDKLRAMDADESISRSDIESLESRIAARMTDAVADGHKARFSPALLSEKIEEHTFCSELRMSRSGQRLPVKLLTPEFCAPSALLHQVRDQIRQHAGNRLASTRVHGSLRNHNCKRP